MMRTGKILRSALGIWLITLILYLTAAGQGTAAFAGEAKWPENDGTAVEDSGNLHIDESHLSEGYFMACAASPSSSRLKMRVEKDGMTLTYDLDSTGEYEVFPLQLGDGTYQVTLYANVGGKKYAQEGQVHLEVQLADAAGPYLYPNQYIHYVRGAPVEELSDTVLSGLSGKEAYDKICEFMKSDFVYDFVRAITVAAGELPDIDGGVERRMGICQDLAAIMVSMLRMQGVASRMVIGYADQNYHAWTETFIDGETIFFDPTAALDAIGAPGTYSVERFY